MSTKFNMEELQDAIEDAQYMSAVNDDIPAPIRTFKYPNVDELKSYIVHSTNSNPCIFYLDVICKNPLGFYMFTKFINSNSENVYGNLLLHLTQFRLTKVKSDYESYAKKIIDKYLSDTDILSAKENNSIEMPSYSCNLVRNADSKIFDSLEQLPFKLSASDEVYKSLRSRYKCDTIVPYKDDGINTCIIVDWRKYMNTTNTSLSKINTNLINKTVDNFTKLKADNGVCDNLSWIHLFDEIDAILYSYLQDTFYKNFLQSDIFYKYLQFMAMGSRRIVADDFCIYRVLGRGGFGVVSACKRTNTGKLYAMKSLSKKRVKLKKSESLCTNERNILAAIDSPYVVCLKYAFVTELEVHLILDIMTGGDLSFHLSKFGKFTVQEIKYFSARIILGIAALHEKKIVFRDLKPDNVLMDYKGYTKISDLGLACYVPSNGITGCCGTRGYWAPEMLRKDASGKREKYGLSVDWFSLGCCMYEFVVGCCPFRDERARNWGNFEKKDKADKDKATDLAILEMEPFYDSISDPLLADIIKKLLHKDKHSRLGANGVSDIMSHPFFNGFDWGKADDIQPPFVPKRDDINMATQSQIGAFDENLVSKIVLDEKDNKVYENWEFINEVKYQEELVEFLRYEDTWGPIKPIYSDSCCILS